MKLSATKSEALKIAAAKGVVLAGHEVAYRTFSSLVRDGLLTRAADGTPEPGFDQCVYGAEGFLTAAGKAAIA